MQDRHIVDVPGVGVFQFRRRTMRLGFSIGAEYSRLTEGVEKPVPWLMVFANAFATLKVLTIKAPDGWNLESMDPVDEESYAKIKEVHDGLIAAEARFRAGLGTTGQANGAGNGGNDHALVSQGVSAASQ